MLEELEVSYIDLTSHNNFIDATEHHEADYIILQIAVIENKNWNCYNHKGYTVTMQKAKTEILSRFLSYLSCPLKILIMSKPKWGRGVKQWLEANGIVIIEVGFQVNKDNLWKAYQKLRRCISALFDCGYPDITSRMNRTKYLVNKLCSLFGLMINSITQIGSVRLFLHEILCKFRLRSNESMNSRLLKSWNGIRSSFLKIFMKIMGNEFYRLRK